MGRGQRTSLVASTARVYEPALFEDYVAVETVSFAQLPIELREDPDLLRNLDARYGVCEGLVFARRQVPLALVRANLPAHLTEQLQEIERCGVERYFADLDREWDAGDGEDQEYRDDHPQGAHRAQLVTDYRRAYAEGAAPLPLVFDAHNLPNSLDLLDGHHRLLAACLARAEHLEIYELLMD